jgi:hypothetical protein
MQNPRNLWNPWLLLEVPNQLRITTIRYFLNGDDICGPLIFHQRKS